MTKNYKKRKNVFTYDMLNSQATTNVYKVITLFIGIKISIWQALAVVVLARAADQAVPAIASQTHDNIAILIYLLTYLLT